MHAGTQGRACPFCPALVFQGQSARILLDQLPTVDKVLPAKKLGQLTGQTHQKVLLTLQELFAV